MVNDLLIAHSHGERPIVEFYTVVEQSTTFKPNRTKDQVTFLVTNSGLRLVSYPRVRVVTFYWNTSPERWTFRKVRRLNNFGHSIHARLRINAQTTGNRVCDQAISYLRFCTTLCHPAGTQLSYSGSIHAVISSPT